MTSPADFQNRLQKNARHRFKWAARQGLTAFRIYDQDIPEYPLAVDWYDGRLQVSLFPRRRGELPTEPILAAVKAVLKVDPARVFWKTHIPKAWGQEQYERLAQGSERFTVSEQGLSFWVNLGDRLDTGLYLDHRNTRARVRSEAKGKRFLNLFAYTGSFSIYAAAGDAASTLTVDMSNTYCDWAVDNFQLNHLWNDRQTVERADVLRWLEDAPKESHRYDLIVLDPPPFSASKRMQGSFNVQRDQVRLLQNTTALLAPGGVLYFSTNFQGFSLKQDSLPGLSFQELTPGSIPEDFHDKSIHRCWRITHAP